jgi:hypothetical protein
MNKKRYFVRLTNVQVLAVATWCLNYMMAIKLTQNYRSYFNGKSATTFGNADFVFLPFFQTIFILATYVLTIKCHYKKPFEQMSFEQMSFEQMSFEQMSFDKCHLTNVI